MSKITLNPVLSLIDATTAANTINANSTTIQTAMDNTLSRDGTQPNTMGSTLDMNSNQIVNLPAPISGSSPARLQDVSTLIGGGTIVTGVPTGGTTGQVLAKNSNTNYDTLWSTPAAQVVPTGGTTSQVLTKNSNANFDLIWATNPSSTVFAPPGGRLTLVTGIAVITSSVSGATTVLYTPANGNLCPIFDGTNMNPTVFTELTNTLSDATKNPAAVTTNSNYDLFVWNDSGTIRLGRGPVWTNNVTRALTLTRQNGVYLNTSTITNGPAALRGTYVGTIHTNSTSTVDMQFGGMSSGGVAASFGVWNMFNRVYCLGQVIDNGVAYTYTSGTIRQARASTSNQASYIVGLNEDLVSCTYVQRMDTPAVAGATGIIGLGFDTITQLSTIRGFVKTPTTVSGVTINTPTVEYSTYTPIGYHTIAALEASDGSSTVSFNTESGTPGSGIMNLKVWN